MQRRIDLIPVTEKDFSKQVEDLLNLFGWRWCHFRPARTKKGWRTALSGYPGFLDYIAARDRLIIFELKSENGKIIKDQQEWLDALAACGQEVYLWKPGDIERIAEILSPQHSEVARWDRPGEAVMDKG